MYELERLWKGRITPTERGYKKGSHYETLMHQASESEHKFYDFLTPEGKAAYKLYCEHQEEVERVNEYDTFLRGFRLGARLILDVVSDCELPMVQVNEMGTTAG